MEGVYKAFLIGEITDVRISYSNDVLTCISTGGPATTVTWTKDSNIITEGTETVLDDPVTAQYTHTLVPQGSSLGSYTCTVANNKPSSASNNITLLGIYYYRFCLIPQTRTNLYCLCDVISLHLHI